MIIITGHQMLINERRNLHRIRPSRMHTHEIRSFFNIESQNPESH